ncbi:unnamed protein product [Moneuplotes crassus]|uniref:Uncharacterized protein n=1 Tax=Euplotes crassus TaxID=5936 RepID=A0AAD1UJL9_EUPCR|nr:unnamed protein product [Moneuplotes crassus]
MFPDLNSEQKCYTDRNPNMRIEQLTRTIKYLEKENKDLSMDLEDVETSLSLSKSMISVLTEPMATSDDTKKLTQVIQELSSESGHLREQLKNLKRERDELKSGNLLLEQVNNDKKSKEEETIAFFEAENFRVVEALEKKEYTLQLLESRLYDCEKFLRELGRSDENIREKLKGLKLNPDVNRKKITNVVLENDNLSKHIKELVEENDKLNQKINELEVKNRNLRKTLEVRPSLLAMGDESISDQFKDMSKVFEALDLSVFDNSKASTDKITNIKKLIPIKDTDPLLFSEKLLSNYRILEQKFLTVNKDLAEYKNKYRISEEKYKVLNDNYKRLSKDYQKVYNNGHGPLGMSPASSCPKPGVQDYAFLKEKNSKSLEPSLSQSKKKPLNAYEALNSIKSNLGIKKENKMPKIGEFQDISSILVAPTALDNQQDFSSEEEVGENILDEVEEGEE